MKGEHPDRGAPTLDWDKRGRIAVASGDWGEVIKKDNERRGIALVYESPGSRCAVSGVVIDVLRWEKKLFIGCRHSADKLGTRLFS
jgi:hypothetical protein